MRTIYVDPVTFKAHPTDDGTRIPVETDFFDGKCDTFVEGYRAVPIGKTWTREDGVVFPEEMITPWKDSRSLDIAQTQYETMNTQLLSAYREGVNSL